ncbi:hypothetical protein EUGRSUZ_H02294, partial [Eucalyptus grandis]
MVQHGLMLVIPVGVKRKPHEVALPLHSRWHPEIPPFAEVRTSEVFRVQTVDDSGGSGIMREDPAEDIKYADLPVH